MIRGMFQNSGYFTQLLIALGVTFMMNLFASALVYTIIVPAFHLENLDISLILSQPDDPKNIAMLKIMQIIMSLFGFLFSALILAYLFSFNSQQYLSMSETPKRKFLIYALALVFVVFPLVNMLGALNQELTFPGFLKDVEKMLTDQDQQNQRLLDNFLADTNVAGLLVNILMIGLIPAIGEELFFRGIMQNLFTGMTRNNHWGIWITAAVFSLVHSKVFTFLPIMVLGALFGYLLVWSRSIWIPVLAHFVNNTTAVLLYYFSNTGKIKTEALEFGSTADVWPFVLASASLTGVLLWYFYKNRETAEQQLPGQGQDQDS